MQITYQVRKAKGVYDEALNKVAYKLWKVLNKSV